MDGGAVVYKDADLEPRVLRTDVKDGAPWAIPEKFLTDDKNRDLFRRRWFDQMTASGFLYHRARRSSPDPNYLPFTGKSIPADTPNVVRRTEYVVVNFLPGKDGRMPSSVLGFADVCLPASLVARIAGIDATAFRSRAPLLAEGLDRVATRSRELMWTGFEAEKKRGEHISSYAKEMLPPEQIAHVQNRAQENQRPGAASVRKTNDAVVRYLKEHAPYVRAALNPENVLLAKHVRNDAIMAERILFHVASATAESIEPQTRRERLTEFKQLAIDLVHTQPAVGSALRDVFRGLAQYHQKSDVKLAAFIHEASREILHAERIERAKHGPPPQRVEWSFPPNPHDSKDVTRSEPAGTVSAAKKGPPGKRHQPTSSAAGANAG